MLYIISGCSCGGKTTLVNALEARGYSVSGEPGRDIVRQELDCNGEALPWQNPIAFAEKCVELSIQRYNAAKQLDGVVFFDRSLVDAVSALVFEDPDGSKKYWQLLAEYRYASTVFMAAPWPEQFEQDAERHNTFEDSVAEYNRLIETYTIFHYSIVTLPQYSVLERVEFVLKHVG